MRSRVDHIPPEDHQPLPADNASRYVYAQVSRWLRTDEPLHPQVAMEIASWYQSPAPRDQAIAAFASHGEVMLDDIGTNLRRIMADPAMEAATSRLAIRALHHYLEEIVRRDTAYRSHVLSSYGHRFMGTDGPTHESCMTCGGMWELVPTDDRPHVGRYVSSAGLSADPCSGDTSMGHGYPGERHCDAEGGMGCDESRDGDAEQLCAHIDHSCNCLFCQ